ncbi:MAG: AAA family ATPase [Bacillota bacterium]
MSAMGWHKILELRVLGGFLDGQVITFCPHLNCLVGGRGAGKTSVIEILRFVLDAYPEDYSVRKKLEQHILGILGDGRVRLLVETAGGQRYFVQRSAGDRNPRVTDQEGRPLPIDPARGLNFGVVIFGQSELERMAEAPAAQLALIDGKCPSFPFLKAEMQACFKELAAKRTELSRAIQASQELAERLAILPEVKERLRSLAGDQLDHLLQRQRERERENSLLEDLLRQIKQHLQQEKRMLESPGLQPGFLTGDTPNGDLLGQALGVFREAGEEMAEIRRRAAGIWQNALQRLENMLTGLLERHQAEERADERLQQSLPIQGLQQALRERKQLSATLLELEKLTGILSEKEQEQAALAEQRLQIKDKLRHLKSCLIEQRLRVCQEFNAALQGDIQVSVTPGQNLTHYREFLASALSKCGLHYNRLIDQIIGRVSPGELADVIRQRDDRYLEQCTGLDRDRAARIVEYLAQQMSPEDLLTLEDILPEDFVEIRLKDGVGYKAGQVLSKGQKCTAVLPLLLLEDSRPLIIDQPEDHLDNSYIFHTVVPSLKKVKSRRQLIFATHNPNIPVNGEAENNLVLSADGCRGRVALQGDLNNRQVKDALNWLLEGGPEALKGRLERYED